MPPGVVIEQQEALSTQQLQDAERLIGSVDFQPVLNAPPDIHIEQTAQPGHLIERKSHACGPDCAEHGGGGHHHAHSHHEESHHLDRHEQSHTITVKSQEHRCGPDCSEHHSSSVFDAHDHQHTSEADHHHQHTIEHKQHACGADCPEHNHVKHDVQHVHEKTNQHLIEHKSHACGPDCVEHGHSHIGHEAVVSEAPPHIVAAANTVAEQAVSVAAMAAEKSNKYEITEVVPKNSVIEPKVVAESMPVTTAITEQVVEKQQEQTKPLEPFVEEQLVVTLFESSTNVSPEMSHAVAVEEQQTVAEIDLPEPVESKLVVEMDTEVQPIQSFSSETEEAVDQLQTFAIETNEPTLLSTEPFVPKPKPEMLRFSEAPTPLAIEEQIAKTVPELESRPALARAVAEIIAAAPTYEREETQQVMADITAMLRVFERASPEAAVLSPVLIQKIARLSLLLKVEQSELIKLLEIDPNALTMSASTIEILGILQQLLHDEYRKEFFAISDQSMSHSQSAQTSVWQYIGSSVMNLASRLQQLMESASYRASY